MSGFKIKNTKKILKNNSIESLDCKHEKILDKFNQEENIILPNLITKRNELINLFKNKLTSFDEKLEIKYKIQEIDDEIKKIKKNKKHYLLKNSTYIFEYFETKKNISDGSVKNKIIRQFF